MSLRDHASNIMDNLIASGIYSAAILAVIKLWPRIVTKFAALRVVAAAVPALLISRLRATLRRSHNTNITIPTGSLTITTAPEPMPPGTASAIFTAMQPLPQQRPLSPFGFGPGMTGPSRFMNNSMMMQIEAAQRHHDIAARYSTAATMPRNIFTLN